MAADLTVAQELYDKSIAINQKAFEAGLFDAAFHSLSASLYFAKVLKSDQPLLDVQRIAKEELEWIDLHYPEYQHSTRSAHQRNNESIFANLARQAGTIVNMRKVDRKMIGTESGGSI